MNLDQRLDLFDHLVVLMLENRSFDNLCGYLYERAEPQHFIPDEDREFRGVAGRDDLVNDDGGEPPCRYRVQKAPWERLEDMYAPYPNAGEFYSPNINRQLYGTDSVSGDIDLLPNQNLMRGFVQDYIRAVEEAKTWDGDVAATPEVIQQIMNCYPPEAVPVLSTLARSFAISDAWFSSVPSSTWPNRSFAHSGTSRGRVANKPGSEWALHHDQPTIFERLFEKLGKVAWRVYGEETHLASLTWLLHAPLRHHKFQHCFRRFKHFKQDCAEGALPAYSFLEPRSLANPNDMHPPFWLHPHVASSVLAGEDFIREVYDAVRRGQRWDRTLLVITFDEHGGLYDHVVPPCNATPPDNPPVVGDEGFRFDRFGLRVPTIFISPYIEESMVVRASGTIPFDHTSIIKTLCERWDIECLTERDSAAPSFASVLTRSANQPRLDTPDVTPRPYQRLPEPKAHQGPLSHLGHQALELSSAVVGEAVPIVRTAGEAVGYLLKHRQRHQASSASQTDP
jgi:phospholipase C